jgi:hypothetical protein
MRAALCIRVALSRRLTRARAIRAAPAGPMIKL